MRPLPTRRASPAPQRKAADHAAWLLLATGAVTLVNNFLPGDENLNKPALTAIAATAIALGVATLGCPWHRFDRRATLILPVLAFGLIATANRFGGVSAYSFGVYFVVVFAWIGMNHPRWTSLRFAPVATAAYVWPLVTASGHSATEVWSVTVPIPVAVLVGETIALVMQQLLVAQEELRVTAHTDELTGVRNRRGFLAVAEHRRGLAQRNRYEISLLFLDLDQLKTINDEAGHAAGDEALRAVGEILRATFRESDVLGRIGGDEFCVLIEHARGSGTEVVEACLRRLRTYVEVWNSTRLPFDLAVTAGHATFDPAGETTIDEMIAYADSVMYAQKRPRPATSGLP
ncbi:MAG: GGDEF domain-containing protein [Actinomycetota bacterium]|nr:GGDEF domain-containing protein [Actinomycetota bacterium]